MKTYYVHPVENDHVWVTQVTQRGKKIKRYAAFQIDLPGKWFEDTFNCHVDGCDYECNTFDEALERGAKFYGGEYEFVYIDDPWKYEFN